jgi:hypothetical protein
MLFGELRGLGGKYFRHRDPGPAITPRAVSGARCSPAAKSGDYPDVAQMLFFQYQGQPYSRGRSAAIRGCHVSARLDHEKGHAELPIRLE